MIAAPPISIAHITLDDPTLRSWLPRLRAQNPHFRHEGDPQQWIGMFGHGKLLSAIAHASYPDGTIIIQAILCAPNKAGRVAGNALWEVLKQQWKGRRVVFFVSRKNRKMLKALPPGTQPTAVMFEVNL